MRLMREKRLSVGGIEVAVAVEHRRVEQLQRTRLYRRVLKPLLRRLDGSARGPNGQGVAEGRDAATPAATAVPPTPEARAIAERIAGYDWYHTLELPHGVVTPGFVDHRSQTPRYGLPADMRGMRALDVATFDGYWAFEMERRGAEVVAMDIARWTDCDFPRQMLQGEVAAMNDTPTGVGFAIAHELLGSRVRRETLSVYDLSPERLGAFDVVFMSDLLLHLRDPQRALENVYSVTRPGGVAIIAEAYSEALESLKGIAASEFHSFTRPAVTWWLSSPATLQAMARVAGFEPVEEIARFRLECKAERPHPKVVLIGRRR